MLRKVIVLRIKLQQFIFIFDTSWVKIEHLRFKIRKKRREISSGKFTKIKRKLKFLQEKQTWVTYFSKIENITWNERRVNQQITRFQKITWNIR